MSETEPQYSNLADLRGALRSDNEDTLQEAYEAVYDAGTKPSKVLASEPPTEALRKAGVIPPEADQGRPTTEWREEVLTVLKNIESNTGGA